MKKQQKSKQTKQAKQNHPKKFFSNFTEELQMGVRESNMLIVIGQIFTIIAAILWCFTIIGLIWGLPMIMGCLKRIHKTKTITIMHIVIAFIFYFFIGAIFTLIGALLDNRLINNK